jgi:iron(III) transport system permease protein
MAAPISLPLKQAKAAPGNGVALGDRLFVVGGKSLLLVLLVLAVLMPLLAIFWRGLSADAGQGGGLLAARELFASDNFHWLLGNSLSVAFTVAVIVIPLAYLFAYALQRTLIPGKGLWRGVSLLPLLAPSMLPAIALVYLFGNQGLLRGLLSDNIYGFWGIVLGEAIYTFPHALMILLSALSLADARLFDAASSMGAGPVRAFFSITWPATRQAVFAAFCLVFTLTITDFGVPVVVGGDYQVLALEAYKAVVGQQQFGRGALIGMVLLVPALLSFAVDAWLRRRQGEALSGRAQVFEPKPSRLRDCVFLAIVLLICAVLLAVVGMAVYSSLVKFWPYNLSLSLKHYRFEDTAGGGWLAYRNSVTMALCTALIGSVVIFAGAYLMEKTQGQRLLNQSLRLLSFIPMAVPGLVLGLGYVFFFNLNGNPLHVFHRPLPDHRADDRDHRPTPARRRVRGGSAVAQGAALSAFLAGDRADLPASAAGHHSLPVRLGDDHGVGGDLPLQPRHHPCGRRRAEHGRRRQRRRRCRHVDPDPANQCDRLIAASRSFSRPAAPLPGLAPTRPRPLTDCQP